MIGVLGGMGPMATADFLTKLVSVTPARQDKDHIPIIVQSFPQIPDRTAAILGDGPSPLPDLISMTKTLKSAGVDFAVIACNTAHHWYDDIINATDLDILHIADAVCFELKNNNASRSKVGLMATPGTVRSGFYQDRLARAGFNCHIPDQCAMERIFQGIEAVKANDLSKGYEILSKEVKAFREKNVETIILGCTELPLILNEPEFFIDSNLALAKACVARAFCDKTPELYKAA